MIAVALKGLLGRKVRATLTTVGTVADAMLDVVSEPVAAQG